MMPNSKDGDSCKWKKEQDQRCPFCFSNDHTFNVSSSLIYQINTAFNGIFENYYGPPVISQPGISFRRLATAQKSSSNATEKKDKSKMNLLFLDSCVLPFPW